jgi:hypothetical protein
MRTHFCAGLMAVSLLGLIGGSCANAASANATSSSGVTAPKIWNEQDLATWALPIVGVNATPNFYSEAEYYAAPVTEFRTYTVYHPNYEPAGYMDWLKQQEPKPLVDPAEVQSDADWVRLGQRVFDELDTIQFRTDHPDAIKAIRDSELLKKSRVSMAPNGEFPAYRWVVEERGKVRLSLRECSGCHMRMQPDGTLLRGPSSNLRTDRTSFLIMVAQLDVKSDETGQPLARGEQMYLQFGVPWLEGDLHAPFRKMSEGEVLPILLSGVTGTFARFNGSPYFTTKISDLIGVKDRRYLDATGTHRNRGPEDIARYAALVSVADDGSIGSHRFLTEKQRRLPFRHSDEAMYALGRFIYTLEPPPNPNPVDNRSRRGEEIFHDEGCAKCHEPPSYTNNKLVRADDFVVPTDHPDRDHIMTSLVHTDPSLALRTRKGTGFYGVPSLRGVWYRGLFEHSGSVKTLEDWFDAKRLEPNYVPTGWKGPGVKARAVPGHEYGLDLSAEDKSALIAFLKTL